MIDKEKNKNNLGIVETKYFTFDSLKLESGKTLGPVTVAYETYGKLNQKKDNAILVCHALTGDAHVAGFHEGDDLNETGRRENKGESGSSKPGWWNDMIGPGKAFDTDKYFVICSNVLGGCKGTTGPSSKNPASGTYYALDFPIFVIKDMVNAQLKLVEHLGIEKLLSVTGGSMGGMQALKWVATYPDKVESVIAIATTLKHNPQQIALSEVGRQAIMSDPDWRGGDYYDYGQPEKGLALARMIGHITYMSEQSMEEKFSRKLKDKGYTYSFKQDFEVEGYLRYRGDSFVKRFDANSYLYLTKAMDYLDLSGSKLIKPGARINTRFLIIAFESDWLYPAAQSEEIVRLLKSRNMNATYCKIHSTYGHDAFLLEFAEETRLVKHFLKKTQAEAGNGK
ncbi:MAG: homoserine O-acetyltransferase [Elusimicrobiota bacterium]